MKRNDVLGAGNEMHAGSSGRGSGLWANLLKRFRVGYLADVNDIVGSRLSLSVKSCNRHRAHSKAREHGQRHCVLSLHDFLPDDHVLHAKAACEPAECGRRRRPRTNQKIEFEIELVPADGTKAAD